MSAMKFKCLYCFLILISLVACQSEKPKSNKSDFLPLIDNATHFHEALDGLTDVIVHDIFSPPVASRIYAYPCIAAHEILAGKKGSNPSLVGKLHDLTTKLVATLGTGCYLSPSSKSQILLCLCFGCKM